MKPERVCLSHTCKNKQIRISTTMQLHKGITDLYRIGKPASKKLDHLINDHRFNPASIHYFWGLNTIKKIRVYRNNKSIHSQMFLKEITVSCLIPPFLE